MPQNKLVGGQIGSIFIKDFRDVCDIADVVRELWILNRQKISLKIGLDL